MNINWFDEDVYKMLLRLGINFSFLTLIIRFTYYRVSRRRDYLFTFYLLGSIVFFICFSLKKLDIDTGMGLGLFAIFSIIRYRTSQIDIREMTYLFLVIGLSVVNALASKKISMIELGIVNGFIFGLSYFLEFGWRVRSEARSWSCWRYWPDSKGRRPNSKRSWSGAPDSPSKEWKSGRSIFWTIRLRSRSFTTLRQHPADFNENDWTGASHFQDLEVFGSYLLHALFRALRAAGPSQYHTTELWTSAAVRYEFFPRSIHLHHEQRFQTDGFVLDKNFTELELKHKWKSGISLAGGLRYIRNNDTEGKITGIEERYRWQADLGYKFGIERFSIGMRVRFQSRREFVGNDPSVNALRWKLALGYNIRKWKWDPKLSTELFKRNDQQESITKMRLTLGTDYSMGNWGSVHLFYRRKKILPAGCPRPKGSGRLGTFMRCRILLLRP